MKRLIVNADDFGRTAGINDGTLEAHRRGIVTSATVMILERAAAEGIRGARRAAPRLSLGLHCVLTGGGTPASHRDSLPTLAPSGRFVRHAADLPSEIDPDEVRRELSAQIALFEEAAGRPPTHLDSHHHLALHPAVEPVFGAIARERHLPVRASSAAARTALRGMGLRVPDAFFDGFYAEGATAENLRRIVASLAEGTSELMCHPGHPDAELLAGSSYSRERGREIEILCDPAVRTLLDAEGVELSAFPSL
ncbi:MAG: ChbG/HpnK family deacetylase [Acidobacteriota bacterium]